MPIPMPKTRKRKPAKTKPKFAKPKSLKRRKYAKTPPLFAFDGNNKQVAPKAMSGAPPVTSQPPTQVQPMKPGNGTSSTPAGQRASSTTHRLGERQQKNGHTYELQQRGDTHQWVNVDQEQKGGPGTQPTGQQGGGDNITHSEAHEHAKMQLHTVSGPARGILAAMHQAPSSSSAGEYVTQHFAPEQAGEMYDWIKQNAGKKAGGGFAHDFGNGTLGFSSPAGALIIGQDQNGKHVVRYSAAVGPVKRSMAGGDPFAPPPPPAGGAGAQQQPPGQAGAGQPPADAGQPGPQQPPAGPQQPPGQPPQPGQPPAAPPAPPPGANPQPQQPGEPPVKGQMAQASPEQAQAMSALMEKPQAPPVPTDPREAEQHARADLEKTIHEWEGTMARGFASPKWERHMKQLVAAKKSIWQHRNQVAKAHEKANMPAKAKKDANAGLNEHEIAAKTADPQGYAALQKLDIKSMPGLYQAALEALKGGHKNLTYDPDKGGISVQQEAKENAAKDARREAKGSESKGFAEDDSDLTNTRGQEGDPSLEETEWDSNNGDDDADPLHEQAVKATQASGRNSVAAIQSQLGVPHERARKIFDKMIQDGILEDSYEPGQENVRNAVKQPDGDEDPEGWDVNEGIMGPDEDIDDFNDNDKEPESKPLKATHDPIAGRNKSGGNKWTNAGAVFKDAKDRREAAARAAKGQPAGSPVNSAADLGKGVGDMGKGITDSMYDNLWSKVEKGDTNEAGAPSALLQVAKAARAAGGLQSLEHLKELSKDYAEARRLGLKGPQFQQAMQNLVKKHGGVSPDDDNGIPADELAAMKKLGIKPRPDKEAGRRGNQHNIREAERAAGQRPVSGWKETEDFQQEIAPKERQAAALRRDAAKGFGVEAPDQLHDLKKSMPGNKRSVEAKLREEAQKGSLAPDVPKPEQPKAEPKAPKPPRERKPPDAEKLKASVGDLLKENGIEDDGRMHDNIAKAIDDGHIQSPGHIATVINRAKHFMEKGHGLAGASGLAVDHLRRRREGNIASPKGKKPQAQIDAEWSENAKEYGMSLDAYKGMLKEMHPEFKEKYEQENEAVQSLLKSLVGTGSDAGAKKAKFQQLIDSGGEDSIAEAMSQLTDVTDQFPGLFQPYIGHADADAKAAANNEKTITKLLRSNGLKPQDVPGINHPDFIDHVHDFLNSKKNDVLIPDEDAPDSEEEDLPPTGTETWTPFSRLRKDFMVRYRKWLKSSKPLNRS